MMLLTLLIILIVLIAILTNTEAIFNVLPLMTHLQDATTVDFAIK